MSPRMPRAMRQTLRSEMFSRRPTSTRRRPTLSVAKPSLGLFTRELVPVITLVGAGLRNIQLTQYFLHLETSRYGLLMLNRNGPLMLVGASCWSTRLLLKWNSR